MERAMWKDNRFCTAKYGGHMGQGRYQRRRMSRNTDQARRRLPSRGMTRTHFLMSAERQELTGVQGLADGGNEHDGNTRERRPQSDAAATGLCRACHLP